MLCTASIINPAVLATAELMTDGTISDAFLRDVAAMQRLPLYVTVADPGPTAADRAAAALRDAEAELRGTLRAFDNARAALGEANRRTNPPICRGALPTPRPLHVVRRMQARAMADLNRQRAALRRAEKALAAARAAFAATAS